MTFAHEIALHTTPFNTPVRYTARLPETDTVVGTRKSRDHRYTHAVVSTREDGRHEVESFHGRRDLALRARDGYAASLWMSKRGKVFYVVALEMEVLTRTKTAPQDINATRRGVITRQLKTAAKSLAHSLTVLEAIKARGPLPYHVEVWGQDKAEALHREAIDNQGRHVEWTRKSIAKLEAEQASLLAAKAAA